MSAEIVTTFTFNCIGRNQDKKANPVTVSIPAEALSDGTWRPRCVFQEGDFCTFMKSNSRIPCRFAYKGESAQAFAEKMVKTYTNDEPTVGKN